MKQADAICAAYNGRVAAGAKKPRSYAAVEAYVARTLPLYDAALRKLAALEPPKRDAAAVHAWLAQDRRVARALRDLALAARRRDLPGVTAAAARAQLATEHARRWTTGLGLQVCGRR